MNKCDVPVADTKLVSHAYVSQLYFTRESLLLFSICGKDVVEMNHTIWKLILYLVAYQKTTTLF